MNEAWALVPVKSPVRAKSRLAALLSEAERGELARHMARDVLAALRATPGLAGIALLSPAGSGAALAAEFGCLKLADDPLRDMSASLQDAAAQLAAAGVHTVVIVPADLPALTPADCSALLAAHGAGVTVVPAAMDGGTNALAMTPPDAGECLFGPDSARRHLEAARRRGIRSASVSIPGFARDIDTVDDVLWLCSQPGGGTARQYLQSSGICARLQEQQSQTG
jgi:2-phospho-L-lactate guanylyltransferase